MTATPRELTHVAELHSALAELNNAALDSRPLVKAAAEQYLDGNGPEGTLRSVQALERLDAALADAGEVLEAASS